MKEDILRKLCSRKLWVAIATFVTGLLIYFGKSADEAHQIEGLIMAGAGALAYIIGEGLADAAGAKADVYTIEDVLDNLMEDNKPPEEQ